MNDNPSVAIIGVGPKGLYAFERLVAEFAAIEPGRQLIVHLIHRDALFGTSPIYHPELPDYIVLNNAVGDINMWGTRPPAPVGGPGPTFVSWYNEMLAPDVAITDADYLDRAAVGRYLTAGFKRILKHLPQGLDVKCHVGEAIDVDARDGRYRIEIEKPDGRKAGVRADLILLATGHTPRLPDREADKHREFAARHSNARFIESAYPIVERLRAVQPGHRVAIRGIGLTFIDAVVEMTEGRGGTFIRRQDGSLSYRRSGREPEVILPFSRAGLPPVPKAKDLSLALRPLRFCSRSVLERYRRCGDGAKVDFDKEVLPLVELEFEREYYRRVLIDGDWSRRLDACGDDGSRQRDVIRAYHAAFPDAQPFDWKASLDPIETRTFATGREYHEFVSEYLAHEIQQAKDGHAKSPAKAAIDLWYEVRCSLETLLGFGGFTPESHERLQKYHFPRFHRVVFGPPVINSEKILALTRAGLIDFGVAIDPSIAMDGDNGLFILRSEHTGDCPVSADVLLDARVPDVDIERDATRLIRNLRSKGMIRSFENCSVSREGQGYRPGAIDMSRGTQFVITRYGEINEDVAVVGIPTENNRVGNKTLVPGEYPGRWARQVIAQVFPDLARVTGAPAADGSGA